MLTARVLLIDDDPLYIGHTCAALRDAAEVRVARRVDADFWQEAAAWQPDVVVVNAFDAASHVLPLSQISSNAVAAAGESSAEADAVTVSARPCVICVASGAGALSHMQTTGDSFYAVVRRNEGPASLLQLLRDALQLRAGNAKGTGPLPTAEPALLPIA